MVRNGATRCKFQKSTVDLSRHNLMSVLVKNSANHPFRGVYSAGRVFTIKLRLITRDNEGEKG